MNLVTLFEDFSDEETDLIIKSWNYMREQKYNHLPILSKATLPFAELHTTWKILDDFLEYNYNYYSYEDGDEETGKVLSKKLRRLHSKRRILERVRL